MTKSVAELATDAQLTVEQLSESSGVPMDRLMAIVLGRWTPSPQDRARIAATLQCNVKDITWGHKTPIQHIYGHGPG